MIVNIDFPEWTQVKGLSQRTRHVYLTLLVYTTALPTRPIDSWRHKLRLRTGQWRATRAELGKVGLLNNNKIVKHPAISITLSDKEQREQRRQKKQQQKQQAAATRGELPEPMDA